MDVKSLNVDQSMLSALEVRESPFTLCVYCILDDKAIRFPIEGCSC